MKVYYITFRSVTYAQRGERILTEKGISCALQRTPRWMEAQGCGYALRVWAARIEPAVSVLKQEGLPLRKLYTQKGDGQLEELAL